MTSTDFTLAPKPVRPSTSTHSFGTHRQSDRPASAIRAGETSMPSAWQTRGISYENEHSQYGAPVRSIADMLADPFRWVVATLPRKIAALCLVGVLGLTLIF